MFLELDSNFLLNPTHLTRNPNRFLLQWGLRIPYLNAFPKIFFQKWIVLLIKYISMVRRVLLSYIYY